MINISLGSRYFAPRFRYFAAKRYFAATRDTIRILLPKWLIGLGLENLRFWPPPMPRLAAPLTATILGPR